MPVTAIAVPIAEPPERISARPRCDDKIWRSNHRAAVPSFILSGAPDKILTVTLFISPLTEELPLANPIEGNDRHGS